ncbi:hypothetical protein NBZ79_18950 [Sneathiella marina]|uniref:Uncharacterized protein n=1 Tax=Sneathiella marina TaxID=2950108 RepID=A0ABY4W6A9_9PROT|nr:hypothetical protein [Sneathiella marina]USG61240.1 hypothetical protein NBZ79_18950 [Sneathiella marina]
MGKTAYWVAGIVSFSAIGLHELLGAPFFLPPLSETNLADSIIWMHRFSWHVGSITMAAMGFMFVRAALKPGEAILGAIATSIAALMGCLGIGQALFGNDILWSTPAPFLWPVIAIVGGLGLAMSRQQKPV